MLRSFSAAMSRRVCDARTPRQAMAHTVIARMCSSILCATPTTRPSISRPWDVFQSVRTLLCHSRKDPHLDNGYAMTSHSSQGQTADRVLIHVAAEVSAKLPSTVAWSTFLCRVHAAAGGSPQTTAKRSTQPSETMFPLRCTWAARGVRRQVGPQFCRSRATPARVPIVTSARRFFEEPTNFERFLSCCCFGPTMLCQLSGRIPCRAQVSPERRDQLVPQLSVLAYLSILQA